jgi:hypothetical protein
VKFNRDLISVSSANGAAGTVSGKLYVLGASPVVLREDQQVGGADGAVAVGERDGFAGSGERRRTVVLGEDEQVLEFHPMIAVCVSGGEGRGAVSTAPMFTVPLKTR